MQALPAHKPRICTRQEYKARRNLTRLSWSTQGTRKLLLRILTHRRRDQGCPYWTGTHSVDADAIAHLLVGEGARKRNDGAFGAGVVEKIRTSDVGVHGGTGEDCVAAAHLGKDVFGEEEEGVDVGGEGVEPLLSVPDISIKFPIFHTILWIKEEW